MVATAPIPNQVESAKHGAAITSGTCGALVMGADYRALGVVRSLGRRGIPVWVINQGGHLVAAASRFVGRRLPWPGGDDHGKIDFLLALCATHKLNGWMLIPTDDYTVGLVSGHHKALGSRYQLTVPPWEQLRWACDKRLMHQLAKNLEVHQPWTVCPSNREELAEIDCPFPVILKPAIRLQPSSLAVPKAWLAEDRKSLLTRYDEASALLSPENLIIQEIVPGGGEAQFSYAALCKDGCSLASLVARRTRQFPRDFGQLSTYVETVDKPEIIEPAERLLAALRFTGLVEVEFKRDPRNGQFKVLDINPRVWGWHTLSRRAGVDFPYLLWLLASGKPVPRLRGRAGERWVHLSADLRMAIEEIVRGRLSLLDYLRSIRGPLESAIFSWDDPLPGLLDLPLFAYGAGKRVLQSVNA
jgi:predicted ATP-grasp superfamily ATP-dependent carboligase